MVRTIIHVDLDAFYCAVEERRDPALRGRPFAVGGQPQQRGVVASCSYPARQAGVHSALPMRRALALCPQLIVVPVRHAEYRAASQRVMSILRSVSPLLEQLSIDEAFLDVSDLMRQGDATGAARKLARQVQRRIWRELGLSSSVGVATNKMVAKIANDEGKAAAPAGRSPGALCVVPPGAEAAFLAPLPVSALWGVGPRMTEQLEALGLRTIGELAEYSSEELIRRFGRHGYHLARHARGLDTRPVITSRETKSISCETTFEHDVQSWNVLRQTLEEQAAQVARQLQRQNLQATTIKIKLRWPDFTSLSRQLTLPHPTDESTLIGHSALQLLRQTWRAQQAVRLLGVGASGLCAYRQLSLWDAGELTRSTAEFPVSVTSEPGA
jgi:DNA polymerase-4